MNSTQQLQQEATEAGQRITSGQANIVDCLLCVTNRISVAAAEGEPLTASTAYFDHDHLAQAYCDTLQPGAERERLVALVALCSEVANELDIKI